ncbi:MAG: hydroxypyruvate isomerase [Alphaproteobacteria bacterium 64-11]|nr:TIM barrel protein [Alphaproteobacteria bacterium]OJU14191.1 MAG: hydroxypyruvate isomerase [Alphaproteobacteria bacterium 64-11]
MDAVNRRSALTAAALAGLAAATPAKAQGGDLSGYAVNLDTWFRDKPFTQRFSLARQAGFTVIEFWKADRGEGMDAAAIRKLADANGLSITQYAPVAPKFGDPAQHGALVAMIRQVIADCRTLGCAKFTLTGHDNVEGMSREAMLAGYVTGLMRIAPLLEGAGITALVEPFNRVNHIGHFLNGSVPAVSLVRSVNSPRVKLLWDFYHMQLEDGDLIEKFTASADLAAHVQIGDVPGRHEPGTGEVNHANLIAAVRRAGFKDPIGLEFMPLDDNVQRAVQAVRALGV